MCPLPSKVNTKDQEEQLKKMQEKYGVDGEQHAEKKARPESGRGGPK